MSDEQRARELLACPFCGGEAERIDFGPGDSENEGGSCIACTRCQSSGPVEFGFKEGFVSKWNRRAAATDSHKANVMLIEAMGHFCGIGPDWDDDRIYDEIPSSALALAYFAARDAIAKAAGDAE
ncbi:hypothetical protein ARC78_14985 [Stenotrophomonas pictorum JCM 9942]|uniref:Restriction alleviation protein, Lar family n=1 Tax=Stenotrophomonas pictorum JCM 9942 TaxID=1236960 RepID=A0A0R0ACG3_9GAMM|nr:Lar family restriction alleviation protein [Stenotrophomonas pictorum]KRG39121.1 hypothetical protein ARC78_14985 [Stenotrophomonas pictorum JCM 9942]